MSSRKLWKATDERPGVATFGFYCPACKRGHSYETPRWAFNGNTERPTFTPSLLMYLRHLDERRETLCHLFVTDGQIRFCDDCPHEYAGKTVPLVDFPNDYGTPGEFVG